MVLIAEGHHSIFWNDIEQSLSTSMAILKIRGKQILYCNPLTRIDFKIQIENSSNSSER